MKTFERPQGASHTALFLFSDPQAQSRPDFGTSPRQRTEENLGFGVFENHIGFQASHPVGRIEDKPRQLALCTGCRPEACFRLQVCDVLRTTLGGAYVCFRRFSMPRRASARVSRRRDRPANEGIGRNPGSASKYLKYLVLRNTESASAAMQGARHVLARPRRLLKPILREGFHHTC